MEAGDGKVYLARLSLLYAKFDGLSKSAKCGSYEFSLKNFSQPLIFEPP